MPDRTFEERLARMQKADEMPRQASADAARSASSKPTRTRAERLAISLAYLERGGVTRSYAYAPAFRKLAKAGIIVKPLHYWSWIGLVVFFTLLFSASVILATVLGMVMGGLPRPVRAIYEAGPVVYLCVTVTIGIGFAAVHKLKAKQIGLPSWSDI